MDVLHFRGILAQILPYVFKIVPTPCYDLGILLAHLGSIQSSG